jgi:hypothetical protein
MIPRQKIYCIRYCFALLLLGISAALFTGCDSAPKEGFTDRKEAKNGYLGGKKWGKWMEYIDSDYNTVSDSNSPY